MAGIPGLEPRPKESKSFVLPLHHIPICKCGLEILSQYKSVGPGFRKALIYFSLNFASCRRNFLMIRPFSLFRPASKEIRFSKRIFLISSVNINITSFFWFYYVEDDYQTGELAQMVHSRYLTLDFGSRPHPTSSLYLTSDFIALMCPYYLIIIWSNCYTLGIPSFVALPR